MKYVPVWVLKALIKLLLALIRLLGWLERGQLDAKGTAGRLNGHLNDEPMQDLSQYEV